MPYKKFALLGAAIAAVVLIIFGVAYYANTVSGVAPIEITSVLTSVQDGTYTGTLPPLDHEVVFTSSMPEEARVIIRQHISDEVAQLTAHPEDANTWMDLALWYHSANDYDAARTVWEFIVDVMPTNLTALNNLGRLYHFDLKDFPKAEEYFMKGQALSPDRMDSYIELFDLYRYSYKKDTTAAVDILSAAIAKFPDDINLKTALAGHYRDTGRPTQARAEYQKALTLARELQDITMINMINTELSKLP